MHYPSLELISKFYLLFLTRPQLHNTAHPFIFNLFIFWFYDGLYIPSHLYIFVPSFFHLFSNVQFSFTVFTYIFHLRHTKSIDMKYVGKNLDDISPHVHTYKQYFSQGPQSAGDGENRFEYYSIAAYDCIVSGGLLRYGTWSILAKDFQTLKYEIPSPLVFTPLHRLHILRI
jgi:hypothetical protein